nr:helix-turn-helix domain-containing protein [Fredinandcohnia onubensis]
MAEQKEDIENIISSYMDKYGINDGDFGSLKQVTQSHLLKIENYLQEHILNLKSLAKAIKESNLSLQKVAESIGISRTTIYNNADTIKAYIENRIVEIDEENFLSLNKFSEQQLAMQEIKTYLDKVQNNILDIEILEAKVDELQQEVKDLYETQESYIESNHSLNIEKEQLLAELRKVKQTSKNNNIVSIKQ